MFDVNLQWLDVIFVIVLVIVINVNLIIILMLLRISVRDVSIRLLIVLSVLIVVIVLRVKLGSMKMLGLVPFVLPIVMLVRLLQTALTVSPAIMHFLLEELSSVPNVQLAVSPVMRQEHARTVLMIDTWMLLVTVYNAHIHA